MVYWVYWKRGYPGKRKDQGTKSECQTRMTVVQLGYSVEIGDFAIWLSATYCCQTSDARFPLRLCHLLLQSSTIERLEQLERAQQVFRNRHYCAKVLRHELSTRIAADNSHRTPRSNSVPRRPSPVSGHCKTRIHLQRPYVRDISSPYPEHQLSRCPIELTNMCCEEGIDDTLAITVGYSTFVVFPVQSCV